MGRPPRFCPENSTHHIIARCHNRQFLFQQDADFETYLYVLRKYKEKFGFKLYNYQLMSNHIHLICGVADEAALSRIMHAMHSAYARWYNAEHRRRGAFWGERFKNILVEDRAYFLELSRYIDLNMVRAGGVQRPEDWPWGGYRTYAYGEENDLIDLHPYFLEQSFKKDIDECRAWYRQFVAEQLTTSRRDPRMSEGPFLGSTEFVKEQTEKRKRQKAALGSVSVLCFTRCQARAWHHTFSPGTCLAPKLCHQCSESYNGLCICRGALKTLHMVPNRG